MKPVNNKRVRIKKSKEPEQNPFTHVKCRQCGEIDMAVASYRETTFGECSVVNIDTYECDDFQVYESDDFEILRYTCRGCDRESNIGEDLFVMCDENGQTREEYEQLRHNVRRIRR